MIDKVSIRTEILKAANEMVNGSRETDYGKPENNFTRISDLWNAYLTGRLREPIMAHDVAAMLALLKIARIASGHGKTDNWVDLAGYAACGGEVQELMGYTRETAAENDVEVHGL